MRNGWSEPYDFLPRNGSFWPDRYGVGKKTSEADSGTNYSRGRVSVKERRVFGRVKVQAGGTTVRLELRKDEIVARPLRSQFVRLLCLVELNL